MFIIKQNSKDSIFQQIKDQIIQFISVGVLKEGDKLPSVRSLAEKLGVNPNTVAKAYSELEQQGVINSSYKRGYFINDVNVKMEVENKELENIKDATIKLRGIGTTQEEIINWIKTVYEKGE